MLSQECEAQLKVDEADKATMVEKHAVLYIPFPSPLAADEMEKLNLAVQPIGMIL